jgi:adenine-specific DNA methylase
MLFRRRDSRFVEIFNPERAILLDPKDEIKRPALYEPAFLFHIIHDRIPYQMNAFRFEKGYVLSISGLEVKHHPIRKEIDEFERICLLSVFILLIKSHAPFREVRHVPFYGFSFPDNPIPPSILPHARNGHPAFNEILESFGNIDIGGV